MSILLPANLFRATALAAGKQDVRYYLNGVRVELLAGGVAIMVATDGTLLHYTRFAAAAPWLSKELAFTLTREATETLCKAVGAKPKPGVMISIDDALTMATVEGRPVEPFSVQRVTGTGELDGHYPEWRRLFIKGERVEPGELSIAASVLDSLQRAAVILAGKHAYLELTASHGANILAAIYGRDDFGAIFNTGKSNIYKGRAVLAERG